MGYLLGWVCIGLAAALAAGIFPFRRGLAGFALNSVAAVIGAVGVPALAVLLGMSPRNPLGLPLAGVGALALLAIVHSWWNRPRSRRHRDQGPAVAGRG